MCVIVFILSFPVVYLLDDVLSAVDTHVGRTLFFDCIISNLRNRGKGVILVTHQVQYLKNADKIIVLDNNGNQAFYGTFKDLQSRKQEFAYLDISDNQDDSDEQQQEESSANANTSQVTNEGEVSPKDGPSKSDASPETPKKQLGGVQAEDKVTGKLSLWLFYDYFKSGGVLRGTITLLVALLTQGILMITDYWLKCTSFLLLFLNSSSLIYYYHYYHYFNRVGR